eukprot:CAMPEP_0175320106 /NCGR_PEP_ID=MMETSP0093-20121207/71283_1 /TAXON_ID=311494 /ORGANISM="Alexandrium monilatum, Strain CCMP3105" /LENGTH=116 /DNA_ID=CAMNT_0016616943 /DNA_START=399 /DNA_END=749 /DNA_ORIENTATION=-
MEISAHVTTSHREDIMKNSSVKTAPKGKMPPTSEVKIGWMNHGCAGTCRGIWLVRTGSSVLGFRNPKYAPRNTSGTEMPNHKHSSANIVGNGTAPEDFCPQMNRLRMKNITKKIPG